MSSGCNYVKAPTSPEWKPEFPDALVESSLCVSPPRGFLRSDKPVGTAVVKLDRLETQSELREIVEVRTRRCSVFKRAETPDCSFHPPFR